MKPVFSHLFKICLGAFSFICATSKISFAQVTPDNTVNTQVNQSGGIAEITGGEVRGSNLFHSFESFSVPTNNEAFFNNAESIGNIFSRVTGGSVSNIDGAIRANGAANLFLINPAGIVFGKNASLNIGGSFFGSTASSILFPDGEYSALQPQEETVLTVDVPIGLGFASNPKNIINNSIANDERGLEVSTGKNLTLLGGNVNLAGGKIFAPGGRVELGGLSTAGEIGINTDGSFSFPTGVIRADVVLTNAAEVNVRAEGGGSINANARNISLSGGELGISALRAGIVEDSNSSEAQAGDITLNATDDVNVSQGSGIFNAVESNGTGNAGKVNITTSNLSLTQGGLISASTLGKGNAGTVSIDTSDSILIQGEDSTGLNSSIYTQVGNDGVGNSGSINIATSNLSLTQGGEIRMSNLGQGSAAGMVSIDSSDSILIEGETEAGTFGSGIFNGVSSSGAGNSGEIDITTANLSLLEGGIVSANSAGQGNAGKIIINVSDTISAKGERQNGNPSGIFSQINSTAEGDSGGIDVTTTNLFLAQGANIDSSTSGKGNAGKITINASDAISVRGETKAGLESLISSQTKSSAVGDSGGIDITTANLSLTQGGTIDASTFGQGDSGLIKISALDTITAEGEGKNGGSRIFSQVTLNGVGDSGGINITTANLSLTNGAAISAGTFGKGDAGKVKIQASDTIVIEGESQTGFNSIVSSRVNSSGIGNSKGINISATNLFLKQGGQVNAGISGQGNAGEVKINASGIISAEGESQNGNFTSGIGSLIEESGIGDAGGISINASEIFLTNKAGISTQSIGQGNAGNLDVQVGSLSIENNAFLVSSTPVGTGGNIALQIADDLTLRENSTISAQAFNEADGGNLSIDAKFIVATPKQNNDLIASAEQGRGGNINIVSAGVFGLEERSSTPPNSTNDIDASSELGVDGTVNLNTNNDFLNSFELIIPDFDVAKKALQGSCFASRNSQQGSFVYSGTGGLPASPDLAIDEEPSLSSGLPEIRPNLQTSDPSDVNSARTISHSARADRKWQIGDPIVEPTDLVKTADGRLLWVNKLASRDSLFCQ